MNVEYKISLILEGEKKVVVRYSINEYWETQLLITENNINDYPDFTIGEYINIPHRNLLQLMESIFRLNITRDQINKYLHNITSDYGTVIN